MKLWRRGLALVVVVSLLSACSNQVPVSEAIANGDGTSIDLGLSSCGGTYEVDVVETAESVTVTVKDQRSPISFGGEDCQDVWTIELSEPLGERMLIDGSQGAPIAVTYQPWNQTQYSDTEYREALQHTVDCVREADPELDVSIVEGPDGPQLSVEIPDVPDGQTRVDATAQCIQTYLDPLRD